MKAHTASGFSLVEVIIAMGLLGGVLISIAGLFIVGGKQVKSGRTSSEALAVAREIQEDMIGWGYSQLWKMFGEDGQAQSYTIDSRTAAACAAWQSTLSAKLGPDAFAEITLEALPSYDGVVRSFADASGDALARAVRIRVTVHWVEVPGRARSVTVGTTRN